MLGVVECFEFLCGGAGLSEGGAGEFFGEIVSSEDSEEFGLGQACFAEDFEDDALGPRGSGGVFDDFDADFVSFVCVFGGGVIDGDEFGHVAAVGLDEPVAALANEGADDFALASFEDFDDAAVQACHTGLFGAAEDDGDDAVAADGVEGLAWGNEEVAFACGLFGPYEAEAPAGGFEGAGKSVGHAGQGNTLAWSDNQLAFFSQGGEGLDEGGVVFVGNVECVGEGALF